MNKIFTVIIVVIMIQIRRNNFALIPCMYASLSPDLNITIFHLKRNNTIIPVNINGVANNNCT